MSGAEHPHEEDHWDSILVGHVDKQQRSSSNRFCLSPPCTAGDEGETSSDDGGLTLTVSGPCARCAMVNVDGSSGSFDCRAFEALAEYRRRGREVHFGQFLQFSSRVVATTGLKQIILGVLRVGNGLKVKKKKD